MAWTDLVRSEPVRVYLYSVFVAIVAALVGFGVLSGAAVPLILGIVVAVLAVPAVEKARAAVTPVDKV